MHDSSTRIGRPSLALVNVRQERRRVLLLFAGAPIVFVVFLTGLCGRGDLVGILPDVNGDRLGSVVPNHEEIESFTDFMRANVFLDLLGRQHVGAVYLLDNVAALESGSLCRATFDDVADDHAFGIGRQTKALSHGLIELLHGDSQPGPDDLLVGNQIVANAAGNIDWNREADVLRVSLNGRVDAYD